jgi:hypothetical protein
MTSLSNSEGPTAERALRLNFVTASFSTSMLSESSWAWTPSGSEAVVTQSKTAQYFSRAAPILAESSICVYFTSMLTPARMNDFMGRLLK